jgi:hypothetical protein
MRKPARPEGGWLPANLLRPRLENGRSEGGDEKKNQAPAEKLGRSACAGFSGQGWNDRSRSEAERAGSRPEARAQTNFTGGRCTGR